MANRRSLPWRKTCDPYHIWVSEIMLQQTQVNTVIAYYERFIRAFPDIRTLAEADLQGVLKLWEGLGYYSRARNFHAAAKTVMVLHDGRVPGKWDAFIDLPGVGDYIASAVQSIAFGKPVAVVDGNVKRVLARIFEISAPANQSSSYKIFKSIACDLLDRNDPGTFNQAVMELGALVCKPARPLCSECPVSPWCLAFAGGRPADFPVKIKKLPVPHHHLAVGVVFKQEKLLIVRRPETGMLGGLWEFPGGRIGPDEPAERACVRILKESTGVGTTVRAHLTRIRHAYTHFKITADVFICDWASGRVRLSGPTGHRWVTPEELPLYPMPKSNHKFMNQLMEAVQQ
ncbi:MAG: A/G-specific adenine glycosylase [Desulfobacteraceae bacterium]|nr:MAG: A/G-specific adenine glycosylase [Desulfobacteraceae bacterium]